MTAAIESIQALAGRFRDNQRNLTLYFPDLTRCPGPESYNRVFGPPVGLTDAQWPTFPELGELLQQADALEHWEPQDRRMEHVFTVDLREISLLGAPRGAAAMMLFISNASFHRACHDGNPHTAVRFVREDELRRGVYRGPLPKRSRSRWSRRFSLIPVDVPGDVFDVPHLGLPDHDLRAQLYRAIADAPARLGGCPIGLADDESTHGWDESSPTVPWGTRADDARSTASADGSLPASLPAPDPEVHPSSGPTRPYETSRHHGSGPTIPYETSRHHGSSPTLPYETSRHQGSSPTLPYEASQHQGSSPTLPYEARRRAEVSAPGRASWPPRRPTEDSSPFLMQFHRRFADIELGRRGVMYVSGRGGFYRS